MKILVKTNKYVSNKLTALARRATKLSYEMASRLEGAISNYCNVLYCKRRRRQILSHKVYSINLINRTHFDDVMVRSGQTNQSTEIQDLVIRPLLNKWKSLYQNCYGNQYGHHYGKNHNVNFFVIRTGFFLLYDEMCGIGY